MSKRGENFLYLDAAFKMTHNARLTTVKMLSKVFPMAISKYQSHVDS